MNSILLFVSLLAIASAANFAFCGVNEAGMEFGGDKLPGTAYTDYAVIGDDSLKTPASYGMNTIRLPFLWERIQPTLNGALDSAHLGYITQTVQAANARQMYVVLDVHNYGRYRGNVIGSSQVPFSAFYDLWNRIAAAFKDNKMVIFGLMNEPHDQEYTDVLQFQNQGIKGIRDAGASQPIFVGGNDWTGAHSWMNNNYKYMINVSDPLNNFMYEMHQYFDSDSSGTHDCDVSWDVNAKLDSVTTWLRQNKKSAFLGEFGINDTPQCISVLKKALAYLKTNSDVWRGFAYWSAGPWWGDYFYSVEAPKGVNQMYAMKDVIPSTYETIAPVPSPTGTPTTPAPVPTPTGTPSSSTAFAYCGVNEAGMEFGNNLPGQVYTDYAAITDDQLKGPASYGMNIIRLPFLWERLQPTLNGSFDQGYLGLISDTVKAATARKMYTLLDIHNYGRYRDQIIGSTNVPFASFYNLWNKIAAVYKDNSYVIFGLCNEPHDMDYDAVVKFMNIGIQGVRDAGATQPIFVGGNDWTGAHSWMSNNYKYMINIVDPLNNFAYEMHQYFDTDSSGTHDCDTTWNVTAKLGAVTYWLRQNKRVAFLGEFGINDSPQCIAIFKQALAFLKTNSDVWRGFSYWAAGPWWGDYSYSVEAPKGVNQMNAMKDVIPAVYTTALYPLSAPTPSGSTTESLINAPGHISGTESVYPALMAIIAAIFVALS